MLAPHRVPYATKDGYVCVLIYNDKQWHTFFDLIGRKEMFDADPRFSSQEARSRNIAEVYAFVAGEMVNAHHRGMAARAEGVRHSGGAPQLGGRPHR